MVPPVHSNVSRNTDAPLNDLAPHGQNLNLLVRKSGQTAMNIGQNVTAAILVMDEGPLRQSSHPSTLKPLPTGTQWMWWCHQRAKPFLPAQSNK